MGFVGKILVRHVSRIAAEGNLAHGIDAEERDDRKRRILADDIIGHETFASNDGSVRSSCQIQIGHRYAADAAVAIAISLVNVNDRQVWVKGRNGGELYA